MVRVKFRYLVVNLLYPEPGPKSNTKLPDVLQIHSPTEDAFHAGVLVRLIRNGVDELYGEYGAGMISAGLKVNYWSPSTSTAIVRCPRDHYEKVWAALTYITHLPLRPVDIPVVFRVIRLSGTIKKAEEEVIRRSQQIVRRAKAWEANGVQPMMESVYKAVRKEERSETEVLAQVDAGEESDEMSE